MYMSTFFVFCKKSFYKFVSRMFEFGLVQTCSDPTKLGHKEDGTSTACFGIMEENFQIPSFSMKLDCFL
jgi:hypothetical protein